MPGGMTQCADVGIKKCF